MDSPLRSADAEFAHIVVFDGIRATTLERWRGLMMDLARCGIVVVFVSSEGVFFHDSQDILKLEHFVPSWTIEEFTEACRDDQFWAGCSTFFANAATNDNFDTRESLLKEKFQVAGHSARFMFRTYSAPIKTEIKGKAGAMGGIESLEQATRTDRSTGAVNTMIARLIADKNGTTPRWQALFPTQHDIMEVPSSATDVTFLETESDHGDSSPRLLSSFATEEVLKVLPTDIERVRQVGRALDNQAIEGYALELQFKKRLKDAMNPGSSLSLS